MWPVLSCVKYGHLPFPTWFKLSQLQAVGYTWNAPALPPDRPTESAVVGRAELRCPHCFYLPREGEEEIWCGNIGLSFGSRPLGEWLPVWLFTRYMTLVKLFIFSEPQFPYLQNGDKKYLTWRVKWELNEMITKHLVKSDLQRMIFPPICESFPEFLSTVEMVLPTHFHTRACVCVCVCVWIIYNTCACLPPVI